MYNQYTRIINTYKTLVGKMAGADYTFQIGRPPYVEGDNTPIVIGTGAFQVEPAGPNWAVDKIPDAEFYVVCGDTLSFQQGDQLWGAQQLPRVTVFSKVDGQEFLAVKTAKQCTIDNIELSYENLYFDYMNSTSAGPDDYFNEVSSLNVATRRVVMYEIPNLPEGMTFTDQTGGWRWSIAKIDYKFGLMELFLEKPNRT
jgi:hypothetical protein